VLLVCVGCDKVMFPWHVNVNFIQRLWDTLYLDVSLLVVMVWTEPRVDCCERGDEYGGGFSVPTTGGIFLDYFHIHIYSVALRPNVGHDLLILEVSRSHATKHHSR